MNKNDSNEMKKREKSILYSNRRDITTNVFFHLKYDGVVGFYGIHININMNFSFMQGHILHLFQFRFFLSS